MDDFHDVAVVKKANIYFDGGVTSRTILFRDGSKKTLGIMHPGQYEFSTSDKEVMEIFSGELDLLLPGEGTWKPVKAGDSFTVPAQAKFTMKVKTLTDYCCSFIT